MFSPTLSAEYYLKLIATALNSIAISFVFFNVCIGTFSFIKLLDYIKKITSNKKGIDKNIE